MISDQILGQVLFDFLGVAGGSDFPAPKGAAEVARTVE